MKKKPKPNTHKKLHLNLETIRILETDKVLAAIRGATCLEPTLAGPACES